MFFYCPFSHAKIDIPKLPRSVLFNHAAAFSSPPTTLDCIVTVMHRDIESGLELYFLHRGDNDWTKCKVMHNNFRDIGSATYKNQNFYFFDKLDALITFSVKNKFCLLHAVRKRKNNSTTTKYLSYFRSKSHFMKRDMKKQLGLGEDVSISICGTLVQNVGSDTIIFNEEVEAAEEFESGHLKGVWIQPRLFHISPNQSWSL